MRTVAGFSTWLGKHLSHEQATWLERLSEKEEIKVVVFSLGVDEALGPTGFTMAFFQECWEIIKSDSNDLFKISISMGKYSGPEFQLHQLIPKKKEPTIFKTFSSSAIYPVLTRLLPRFSLI